MKRLLYYVLAAIIFIVVSFVFGIFFFPFVGWVLNMDALPAILFLIPPLIFISIIFYLPYRKKHKSRTRYPILTLLISSFVSSSFIAMYCYRIGQIEAWHYSGDYIVVTEYCSDVVVETYYNKFGLKITRGANVFRAKSDLHGLVLIKYDYHLDGDNRINYSVSVYDKLGRFIDTYEESIYYDGSIWDEKEKKRTIVDSLRNEFGITII